MKLRTLGFVTVGSLLFASAAGATQYCAGKVNGVLMFADGRVLITSSWRGDYTQICSTQTVWGNIPPETCFAWYGAALKARADNSNVTVYYPSDGGATCATLPTYDSSPAPGYFLVNN